VKFESDNHEISLLTTEASVLSREGSTGIGEVIIAVEGRQVGSDAIITATYENLKAEAFVKIVAKKPEPDPPEPKKHGGLFNNIRFSTESSPKYRVYFNRENSEIVIAVKSPSVALYMDERAYGADTAQGQVLMAELITESICSEIATRGVHAGKYIVVAGSEADTVRREYVRLQNQYAKRIHESFVEPAYRSEIT